MVVLNEFQFRLLENFLDHVKANGGKTDCDDFLTVDGKFISSLSHGIQGTVGSTIETLGSLKALDAALCALSKTVKNSLSMAREELLPAIRHHGVYSLPLEVVSHIFQQVHVRERVYDGDIFISSYYAAGMERDETATQSIPLVNRYFREIAIGTPGLWTHLTTSQNPTLFIERSKCLGLDVNLTADPHFEDFLGIALPYAERWTSLSIPYELHMQTREVLAGKTFTALRELSLNGTYDGGTLQQPASLTCLNLYLTKFDLERVTKFLQPLASLTELSLVLCCYWSFNQEDPISYIIRDASRRRGVALPEPEREAVPKAVLPNVKTLRMRLEPRDSGDSSLTDFLASLHMPNLSDLSVDISPIHVSLLTDWIAMIFPKGDTHWPPLERFDLTMSYDFSDDEGTSVPHDLFERIPTVRHLSICAINGDSPDPCAWNVQFPGLRTLCFRDCNEFGTDFVLGIENIYKSPEFETLIIHNCKKIDTEVVRKMMPEGKTLVSTVD